MTEVPSPSHRPRTALLGAGTVGTAVASLLKGAGCPITGVWSRSGTSSARAERRLDAPRLDLDGIETIDAELVMVGGTDAAIGEIALLLQGKVAPGTVVAHFSGSLGPDALAPALEDGAVGLASHPVQACPTIDAALERLPGSTWGVTCDEGIQGWASGLIEEHLRGSVVVVPAEVRPIWHAASVMTSNGIAALLAFGESLLASIDVDDPVAVLGPLAAGTVANARAGGGGGKTLTGPLVRGEVATVQRHLDALRAGGDREDDYKTVARMILGAAVASQRIDDHTRSRMQELLDG